jgi:hypothetical protein
MVPKHFSKLLKIKAEMEGYYCTPVLAYFLHSTD